MNKEQNKIKCPVCNTGIHRAGYVMEYNDERILVENVCGRCGGKGFVKCDIDFNSNKFKKDVMKATEESNKAQSELVERADRLEQLKKA